MNEPTPTPTRRARRQVMSDEGRMILQRERQRLAREQAVLGERLANEARRNEGRQVLQASRVKPEDAAIQRGMVKRIAAVLASEGVNVRLDIASADMMTAWTNFAKIHVRYRNLENKRLVAATLRGLMYHEAGHCRWTTPYNELQDMLGNKANLVPGLLPPLNEDGTQPNPEWNQFHRAWNALEDQRMETAVVSDSPTKAMYLTPMMMTELMETPAHAVANWPLTIWRRYLPRKLRAAARRDFVKLHGEALAQSFEAVVDSYVRATDAVTMMTAVVEMHALLQRASIKLNDFGHEYQDRRYPERNKADKAPTAPVTIPILPDFEDDEDEDDDETVTIDLPDDMPDEDEADEADADEDMPEAKDEDDADDDDEDTENGAESGDDDFGLDGGGADHSKELSQDDIDSAKADAEAERDADPTLDDDVEAFHNAMEDRVSDLMPYVGGLSDDAEATADAENLAAEIERSFQMATMDREPAWVDQQRRGIINVARYEAARMSPAGETDFYRDWVEDDQPGYNLAVSLMLDYSSSMHRFTTELSQVGYAVKLACQRLDIPCTVTLWDNEATVLYDAKEQADGLLQVNTAGATNPTTALADLENQGFDKVNHVVLIMTDGEWQGEWSKTTDQWNSNSGRARALVDQATLAYHAADRIMVGFGFAESQRQADRYAKNLSGYGCPESFGITNLMEIPERLRDILIALA